VWGSWAYDPAQHDVVLFGGDTGGDSGSPGLPVGTTWTWDGRWTEHHPVSSPSARTGAAMVYDPATRQMLLFGGSTGVEDGFQGDTWAWTGRTWRQLHPAAAPAARHNADLVYDAATRTVILFGGFGGGRLADTWSWNGSSWTQLHPARSPGADTLAWQAAYDPASRQLVAYGGDFGGPFGQATWTWNGRTWTRLHPPASPGPRGYGTMTYDPALGRVLLFGGSTPGTRPLGIWEWNGSTWQRQ
jgi:hypothetical protein